MSNLPVGGAAAAAGAGAGGAAGGGAAAAAAAGGPSSSSSSFSSKSAQILVDDDDENKKKNHALATTENQPLASMSDGLASNAAQALSEFVARITPHDELDLCERRQSAIASQLAQTSQVLAGADARVTRELQAANVELNAGIQALTSIKKDLTYVMTNVRAIKQRIATSYPDIAEKWSTTGTTERPDENQNT
ncbi:hypothetical protein PPROV_000160600 [Pycnococcus provasolii]|uniref:KxDL domain-containing protein n=1 Tax=Pycnococcus provasolii TaxID=41880 RepID=A0A830HB73_9CHLO|nr:hypothetical protein PPROV_000160600 [Pycnococcus provasolii]